MAQRSCGGFVAFAAFALLLLFDGIHAGAEASAIMAAGRMSTIRIEQTRPGGMPGEPRESSPFWQPESGSALSTRPPVKRKGRRR